MKYQPKLTHRLYRSYLRGPEHPMKGRIIRWFERAIFPGRGLVFDVSGGFLMHLHPRDYWEYHLIRTGSYQSDLNTFVTQNLKPGDTVAIGGISFGLQTIIASHAVGKDGRVIAVDPHPKAIVRTHQNITLNNLPGNIRLVSAALGEETAIIPMGDIPDDHIGWGSFVARETGQTPFYVQVESLPNILQRLGVSKVDLFVLEVIGFEMPVLKGLGPGCLPGVICVYVHPWVAEKTGDDLMKFRGVLEKLGYECRTLDGRDPLKPEDLRENQLVGVRKGVPQPRWIA